MPKNFPFTENLRDELANRLVSIAGAVDPLSFVQQRIFRRYPDHIGRIPTILGRAPFSFYRDVVRYCEMSAWSEDPALIIELLNAFDPVYSYENKINDLKADGPFRCHPPGIPFYVCQVAAELPLFGRPKLRSVARDFDRSVRDNDMEGKRVLLVNGPEGSGKTYTNSFFRYLAAIQPLKIAALYIDFEAEDILTLSANADVPVELFLVQKLEKQVRERRSELLKLAGQPALPGLPLLEELGQPAVENPFEFSSFKEEQRSRWASGLAKEFVEDVLSRINQIPAWWVLVLDNYEKAPKEIEQFIHALVEITAGINAETAREADTGCLRMVLLGESKNLLPISLYKNHVLEEDLSAQKIGKVQIKDYFILLCYSRRIAMDDNDLTQIVTRCMTKTQSLMNQNDLQPEQELSILTTVVIEETKRLEEAAAKKRG